MTPPDSRLPTQLRVVGATDLERRVLDAASRELPSVELTRKMQQALGLSIAASTMTAATVKSSSGAAMATTGAPAFAWPAISLGVLALAVTGAVVGLRSTAGHHAMSRPAVTVPATVPGPAPVAPKMIVAASPAPTARAAELPASSSARAHRRAGAAALAAATPGDLRAEIALVDAARSAVTTGADDRALALLNRYDSTYRTGTFRPEAAALRIEALGHLGHTVQARTLAHRFIAAHPDSPLAERVARVTGTATR